MASPIDTTRRPYVERRRRGGPGERRAESSAWRDALQHVADLVIPVEEELRKLIPWSLCELGFRERGDGLSPRLAVSLDGQKWIGVPVEELQGTPADIARKLLDELRAHGRG